MSADTWKTDIHSNPARGQSISELFGSLTTAHHLQSKQLGNSFTIKDNECVGLIACGGGGAVDSSAESKPCLPTEVVGSRVMACGCPPKSDTTCLAVGRECLGRCSSTAAPCKGTYDNVDGSLSGGGCDPLDEGTDGVW